jgi:hypothetical protein
VGGDGIHDAQPAAGRLVVSGGPQHRPKSRTVVDPDMHRIIVVEQLELHRVVSGACW